ncbi:Dicer-like protein 2 [Cytospora mali]|uniref:Dicer-like protein 2 n=1 Tax=Cytospora mali TaxID=578113 RepID=A0A194V1C4_CYTMA|nr:Dicer-like protein 2 [Valsa mali var. pyri (nom. inval.)]
MAYYSDSSDSEAFEDAVRQVISEEGVIDVSWSGEGSSEEDKPRDEGPRDAVKMTARAYQIEMLEASLKENVIVAMDTGSGKTQVAVLRIRAELEKNGPDPLIWFMAPTIPLCYQQYGVIKSQITCSQHKIITGANNVDSWSKSTWERALTNIRIVVSTHQVVLDALLHSFIQISSISLIIFDEAHNCTKKHAGSRIMKEFYWEAKTEGKPVPHILGLTASPVVRSDISSLEELEATLDACCRSPTRHREELLAHTQPPSMFNVSYKGKSQLLVGEFTESMSKIQQALTDLNIVDDPFVKSLRAQNNDRSRRRLSEAIMKRDTYIQKSMKTFCRRNGEICGDLGSWAADWYIYETIQRYMTGMKQQGPSNEGLKDADMVYLARVFQTANITPPSKFDVHSDLSEKVRQLISVLLKYEGDARGIVFVKERATTVVLAHILTIHPEVSKRYRTGTMVGTSFVPNIKQHFLDLAEKDHSLSLEEFRAGRLNLLVATSVLEEGIDVPACNLVICMDKPTNLKSFIQRRGRARMRESHLYLFEEETDAATRKEWKVLEAEMKRHYNDDMRELEKIQERDDAEPVDYPELRVESTGARLTINDVKSRLEHFCATLSSRKYVDFKPDYIIEKVVSGTTRPGASTPVKATVLLPITLPQNVRQATSMRVWLSEKDACKDAAFQAYKALYEEGLVGQNLLPLRDKDLGLEIEGRPGMMEANAQYNPWVDVALAWNRESVKLYRRSLKLLDQSGSTRCEFELVLPVPIPDMPSMVVYLDHNTQFTLQTDKDVAMADADDTADYSLNLLSLSYGHRRLDIREGDSAIRLIPRPGSLPVEMPGRVPFDSKLVEDGQCAYLVRDESGSPYYYESLLPTKPPIGSVQKAYRGFADDSEDESYLVVKKCPRGPGSFKRPPTPSQPPGTKPYSRILPATSTTVDTVPLEYAEFGFLVPSLIQYIGLYLTATQLSNTLLGPLGLSDVSMIVDAICASGARAPTNYERIEFLGDSILKLCTTVNVAATKLRWPEGLLSRLKDSIISNARLCAVARESGLDQFIVTGQLRFKGNNGERWRPPYISDLVKESDQAEPKREMSTKTLADVVESIIGVSYIDGGLPKALHCMSLFLGEGKFDDFSVTRDTLFGAAEPKNMVLPSVFRPLEELIGYEFREKSLLVEAMTHASFNVPGTTACLDRLEFIGDSILDYIVVQELYAINEPAPLENWEMHLLRTAVVNGDILGFLVMEWSLSTTRFDVVFEDNSDDGKIYGKPGSPELRPTETPQPLWSFMRYSSNELTVEREVTCKRHAELRAPILEAVRSGTHYPWALLAQLHAQKFFSDLFEALVGAIWVDSGSFDACAAFLERSGVLTYLRRMLRDRVHVLHPKEELGRLANSEVVGYEVREVPGEEGDGARGYACRVTIGEREVVEVGGAKFREEAKVRAATEAVRVLSGRGP